MKISVSPFGGENIKLAPHIIKDEEAQVAMNAKLYAGSLRSFRRPLNIVESATTGIKGFFKYIENTNGHWVESTNILDAVRSPIANDPYERMYFTGETQPRYFANDYISSPFDASTDYIKMGIPTPASAPTYNSGHTGSSNYVAHFYTYVNRYGIEGPPSPIVSCSTWDGASHIFLDGFTEAPEGYACNSENGGLSPKIRLYRVASAGSGLAAFQFVKDTVVNDATNYGTLTIEDDVAAVDLGEVCPSIYWYAPYSGMKGLVGMSNGVFAGFYGNTLYFSDPYMPEAWPTSYEITFSEQIIGIGTYGTNVVVCTDEFPYIVYGSHPSNMAKQKLAGFYPCESRRGIVSTEFGVLYPSAVGLMLVDQDGVKNVTESILSKDNMADLKPSYWTAGYHDKTYIAFYYVDSVTYGGIHLDIKNGILSQLDIYRNCVWSSYDDYKFYVQGRQVLSDSVEYIQEWEGDDYNFLKYTWRSKKWLVDKPINLSTARVRVDINYYNTIIALIEESDYLSDLNATLFAADLEGSLNAAAVNVHAINHDTLYRLTSLDLSPYILFKLYVDTELKFSKLIMNDKVFRLPSGFRGDRWEIQLEGYVPINKLEVAPSMEDLISG